MHDVQRSLFWAVLLDAVLYSYTLFAFLVHAINGDSRHDDVFFSTHDEPALLLHSGHAFVASAALWLFSCARNSRQFTNVLALIAAGSLLLDVAAVVVHVETSNDDHDHVQALSYLYATLALALSLSSTSVMVRARRVTKLLDPHTYPHH